jgi:hypothetical protein
MTMSTIKGHFGNVSMQGTMWVNEPHSKINFMFLKRESDVSAKENHKLAE